MIDRVYFIFPDEPELDFDIPLSMFEAFCDFVHKKNANVRTMRDMYYDFYDKKLYCERWVSNKSFLQYWAQFRAQYGRVDELLE